METVLEKCCEYNNTVNPISAIAEPESFPAVLDRKLNKIIKREGFSTYKVNKRKVSSDGGNYLGVLYEAEVKGKTRDGEEKEINLFMKHILVSETFPMLDVYEAYVREAFTYTELFRIFSKIQDEAKVPKVERFQMVKGYEESDKEVIILEDLSKQGFKTNDRMEGVSLEFAELSIKQLAKFHALSLILKTKRPEYFAKKLKTLKCTYRFSDNFFTMMRNFCNSAITPLDEDDKTKAQKFIERAMDLLPTYCNDTTSVGCCVVHGDYRPNNILVKEMNGKPVEAVPVDYQLIYYGCPINDLFYFIFNGSDESFRAKYLDHLKVLYHETMGEFVKYFHLDIEEIYPRAEYEKQFKEKLQLGLIFGLFLMPFIFADANAIPDISKELDSVKMDKKSEERVKGLIDDFKNWGYL